MSRKTRRRKPPTPSSRKVRITPSGVLGMGIGVLLLFTGAYAALVKGEYGGFYVVALGVAFTLAVGWGVIRRR